MNQTQASSPSALVTPPSYGPHLIYAYSVDGAGNRSDTATYLYYAKRAQERDQPGDLNGDGFKDIWNTDTNGTLLTYAGHGSREFSSATNGGGTFPGQQVTFSGDWGQEDTTTSSRSSTTRTTTRTSCASTPTTARGSSTATTTSS